MKLEIIEVVNKIENITDHLYKQEIKIAYNKLNNVLVDLSAIIDQLFSLNSMNQLHGFDIHNMVNKLTEALQAMQEGDNVLLADILQYEIADQLKEIHANL